MKKILPRKLQLRSTTIAALTGHGLSRVRGGTGINDDDEEIGGGNSGSPICEPAGNWSKNDPNGGQVNCHRPG
jgi:hypothetical protein